MFMKSHVSHRFDLRGHPAVLNVYFDRTVDGIETWPLYNVTVEGATLGKRRLVPMPWNNDILISGARGEYRHLFF